MGTVRLYERVKVPECETQFQILIHARTRFARSTVEYALRMTKIRSILVGMERGARKSFRGGILLGLFVGIFLGNLLIAVIGYTIIFTLIGAILGGVIAWIRI